MEIELPEFLLQMRLFVLDLATERQTKELNCLPCVTLPLLLLFGSPGTSRGRRFGCDYLCNGSRALRDGCSWRFRVKSLYIVYRFFVLLLAQLGPLLLDKLGIVDS